MSEKLPMSAYYYAFDETGCVEIDRILSVVARAGKSFHHTDQWGDTIYGTRESYVDLIQGAANNAANALRDDAHQAAIAQAVKDARTAALEDEREQCCKDVCAYCEKVGSLNKTQTIMPATLTENEQYEHSLIWDEDKNATVVRCAASHIRIRQWRYIHSLATMEADHEAKGAVDG